MVATQKLTWSSIGKYRMEAQCSSSCSKYPCRQIENMTKLPIYCNRPSRNIPGLSFVLERIDADNDEAYIVPHSKTLKLGPCDVMDVCKTKTLSRFARSGTGEPEGPMRTLRQISTAAGRDMRIRIIITRRPPAGDQD